MGLETATYLNDLVATNPLYNDGKTAGDDHLRLLKATLQATLPGLAGRFRRIQSKSGGYGPAVTDNASVLRCTTGLTLTLATVATYGNGYELVIVADGGDVTLTPNGTEKINGQGTFVIPNGSFGVLWATTVAGAEFYLTIVPLLVVNPGVGADITGNTTLTAAQFGGVRRITATAIVTLPAIAGVATGRTMLFKSTTTGDVTLAPNGAETIDGVAAAFRLPAYCELELTKIASGWLITRAPATYVGELRPLAAAVAAPNGWLRADFAAVSRTTYAGLFAVVASAHGSGDGSTTFNVPDTRDRQITGDGTGAMVETITSITAAGNAVTVGSNLDKWVTGMPVTTSGCSGFTGLVDGSFWIVRNSSTSIKIATSLANAQNGTVVTVTGTGNATFTWTGAARTVGDRGGEDTHAMSLTELLAHTHLQDPFTVLSNGGAAAAPIGSSITVGGTTQSRGGNAAMNIETPFTVARYMVKL
jgi:microcystin-dependent protein